MPLVDGTTLPLIMGTKWSRRLLLRCIAEAGTNLLNSSLPAHSGKADNLSSIVTLRPPACWYVGKRRSYDTPRRTFTPYSSVLGQHNSSKYHPHGCQNLIMGACLSPSLSQFLSTIFLFLSVLNTQNDRHPWPRISRQIAVVQFRSPQQPLVARRGSDTERLQDTYHGNGKATSSCKASQF